MSSVASLVPSTPDMPADFSPQTSSAHSSPKRRFFASGATRFFPFEKSPFASRSNYRIRLSKRSCEDFVRRSMRRNRRNVSRDLRSLNLQLKCNQKKGVRENSWNYAWDRSEKVIDECFRRIERDRVVERHSPDFSSFPRSIRSQFKRVSSIQFGTGIGIRSENVQPSYVRNYRNKYRTLRAMNSSW